MGGARFRASMAVNSYLPDVAGALVAAGVFDDEASAVLAVRHLHDVGLRGQDITLLANDAAAARRVAAEGDAWAPKRSRFPIPFRSGLPKTVRHRYGRALDAGKILVIAVSDGQPAETLATVLDRVAKARDVSTWWQEPSDLFAPPEQGGPL